MNEQSGLKGKCTTAAISSGRRLQFTGMRSVMYLAHVFSGDTPCVANTSDGETDRLSGSLSRLPMVAVTSEFGNRLSERGMIVSLPGETAKGRDSLIFVE
jgi:hypothetical protein